MNAVLKWAARPRSVLLIGLVLLVAYPIIRPYDAYPQVVLLMAFLLATQAVGWNIISGYAGYVSLGHGVFLGLGSYTAGIVAARTGLNPFLLAPLGGLVAVLAAVIVGSVVLRGREGGVQGPAFVIITIALLLATQVVATNWDALTNGTDGITLALPTWSRDILNIPFYYAFLALMLVSIALAGWIRRTKFGSGLVAIREDEGKAAAIGIDTTRYKIVAYGASAFVSGAAGAVYAYFLSFLNPTGAFGILGSVTIVLAALVGGRGTLYGPVFGAFAVQFLSEAATVFGGGAQSRVLLFGLVLVVVVLFLPAGVLPGVKAWREGRRRPKEVTFLDHVGAREAGRFTTQARTRDGAAARDPDRPLLEVSGLVRQFGGLAAVDGADVAVTAGSITGLIGPNGSGKTTLFNLVSGGLRADAGQIRLDGQRIDRFPPWRRSHAGLARTYQITRLFKTMSVLENVVAPLPDGSWSGMWAGAIRGQEAQRARELLAFVGMADFADRSAGELSYGQQKLVELAQALMTDPKLIMLDEPAGGVNPGLVDRIADIIREVNKQGVTFLVVEHNIPLVLDLCDPVVVLARGKVIAQGTSRVINDPVVLNAYLGQDWNGMRGTTPGLVR